MNDGSRPAEEPAFGAPWQAQAFALAMLLRDRGVFTWAEWAETLGAEIREGSDDAGDAAEAYYRHWLAALERLVIAKGLTSPGMLDIVRGAWDDAARAAPHGQPILLAGEGTRSRD